MSLAKPAQPQPGDSAELDRHAFNAAFHELGLRWHWDAATYDRLCARAGDANAATRQYLSDSQSHLLRAYDESFLVDAIVTRMARVRQELAARVPHSLAFDWLESSRGEIGF